MASIGYARVSTTSTTSRKAQHVDNQVQRLTEHGCKPVFQDEMTGTKASRPGWDECLAHLREGDILAVTKLDRIGRSLLNVVDIVNTLHKRGVGVRCLDQGEIDTTTPNGNLVFQIMAALAEWEAAMTKERTIEGLAAAKVRHGGKLPTRGPSITADQIKTAEMLAADPAMSAARIADVIGVSRATLYRHVDLGKLRAG
jgi:DNA invertase Pin-like site-specific DNA recombinase